MSVYKTYTNYGRVTVGADRYVLLRPVPFEPEHDDHPSTAVATAFFVAFHDGFQAYHPHVLYASNGSWHVDLLDDPENIEVAIKETVSKEPVRFPVLQELD